MSDARHIMLVRHPETTANVEGRWVGRGDTPLTEVGTDQARRLVAEIAGWDPAAIYSSPLPRALDVARSVASQSSLSVTIDDRLTELDFGLAEGLTYEETLAQGIQFDFKNLDAPVAPEGESRRDILERTGEALSQILESSSRAVVVTHGGVFRSAIVELLGLSIEHIWTFHIRNAQIAEVRIVDDHPMVERFFQA